MDPERLKGTAGGVWSPPMDGAVKGSRCLAGQNRKEVVTRVSQGNCVGGMIDREGNAQPQEQ